MSGIEIKALVVAVLIAFGVMAPLPEVLAGMVLGLGCCYAVMLVTPPRDKLTLRATLFVGFIVTLLAAIAQPYVDAVVLKFFDQVPKLQLTMAVAGGLSIYIAKSLIAIGKVLHRRAGEWPGLPGEEGGKGNG